MSRPHIDFIHIDDIDWVDLALPGGNRPIRMKPLSRDPDTGGVTAIVEFPPGFERRETGYNTSDEDIFYLEGEMTWGDLTCRPFCYAFHPAGKLREPLHTADGALVFASFTETPNWNPSDQPGPMFRPERAVPLVDSLAVTWQSPRFDDFPGGAARKPLRNDPEGPAGRIDKRSAAPVDQPLHRVAHLLRGGLHPGRDHRHHLRENDQGRLPGPSLRRTCTGPCIRATRACYS